MARLGEVWRDVARCGEMWRDVARCGGVWRGVSECFGMSEYEKERKSRKAIYYMYCRPENVYTAFAEDNF